VTGEGQCSHGVTPVLNQWERAPAAAGAGSAYAAWISDEHEDLEIDVAWSRYLDANLSTIAGYRFTNVHEAEDRFFGGVRYRLPYLIQSELTLDDELDVRLDLGKAYLVTQRLELFGEMEYDTNTDFEWEGGLGWTISKRLGIVASYHSEHEAGFGLSFRL
jgi:hypothetical protein